LQLLQLGRSLLHLIYDGGEPVVRSIAERALGEDLLTFLRRQKTHASDTRFRGLPLAVVALGGAFTSMLACLRQMRLIRGDVIA
jgi:hypothetical protein